MTEDMKLVISKLNEMFDTNYNVISFDSLSTKEYLQIMCNVLKELDAAPQYSVEDNIAGAVLVVLESMQRIKYSPPRHLSAEQFRDGLAEGKRSVLNEMLYWLVTNQKQVRERAYVAKYVERIECPPELMGDPEIQALSQQHDALSAEFFSLYGKYKKVQKETGENDELQNDIVKMEQDIENIDNRIKQQYDKIAKIPNLEEMMQVVKEYRQEMAQEKKLEEQLKEQEGVAVQMDREIKRIKDDLNAKRANRPSKKDPLKKITYDLKTNKTLATTTLPNQLRDLKAEIEIYQRVTAEPEPTPAEMDRLKSQLAKLVTEVNKLSERKIDSSYSSKDNLDPFQRKLATITAKKEEMAAVIEELKSKIADVDKVVDEKQIALHELIGGPLIHGAELKEFVAKLREKNLLYREYKARLQSMTTELGVLTRTLDVLKSLDPGVEEVLANKGGSKAEEVLDDEAVLKNNIRKVTAEIDQIRAVTAQHREELSQFKTQFQEFAEKYNQAKESYEQTNGTVLKELHEAEDEVKTLEDQIKESEEKWKIVRQDNVKKEDLLVRISNDILNSADDLDTEPTQIEVMQKKLEEEKKRKAELGTRTKALNEERREAEEQMEIANRILNLLKCKEELN